MITFIPEKKMFLSSVYFQLLSFDSNLTNLRYATSLLSQLIILYL